MSDPSNYKDPFYKYYKPSFSTVFTNPNNIDIRDTQECIKKDLDDKIKPQLHNKKIDLFYLSYTSYNIDNIIYDKCKFLKNNGYTIDQCEIRYLYCEFIAKIKATKK